jgi:outer membrane protein OmpA-like peptidoglycan-associated protein
VPENPKEAMIEADKEAKLFEKAEEAIKKAFENDPNLRELRDQIIVEQTPEGLKIDIIDDDKKEMFQPGTAALNDYGQRILRSLLKVIEQMPNMISITGHTDATPYARKDGYTNWELSADRANSARRYLLSQGMNKDRTGKVVGKAAQELLTPQDPTAARNRRITIILLRGSHLAMPMDLLPAPRALLSVPDVDINGKPIPAPAMQRTTPATMLPVVPQPTTGYNIPSPADAITMPPRVAPTNTAPVNTGAAAPATPAPAAAQPAAPSSNGR